MTFAEPPLGLPEDVLQAAALASAGARGLDTTRVQTYETTIHGDLVPSMRFATVPAAALERAVRGGQTLPRLSSIYAGFEEVDPTEALEVLGLETFERRSFYPDDLPAVLWECLTGGRARPVGARATWDPDDRRLFAFAEYLAFEDLIPFESSSQKSSALSKLMIGGATTGSVLAATAAGAKVGAAGGLVIGAPTGPLVFITTPVGFVVGGLVGAMTGGLGERLYEKVRGKPA